jgi:hypothetical protein
MVRIQDKIFMYSWPLVNPSKMCKVKIIDAGGSGSSSCSSSSMRRRRSSSSSIESSPVAVVSPVRGSLLHIIFILALCMLQEDASASYEDLFRLINI